MKKSYMITIEDYFDLKDQELMKQSFALFGILKYFQIYFDEEDFSIEGGMFYFETEVLDLINSIKRKCNACGIKILIKED